MRIRTGQIVAIHFADHCTGSTMTPLRFVVYGRLANISKDSITIAAWDYDPPGKETPPNITDSNRTTFTIVRSCISSIVHLGEKK